MTTTAAKTADPGLMISGVQRTLLALAASALSAIPLCTLLSDRGWLIDVWTSMLVAVLPALVIRTRRQPGALQIWPGVVLLVPWLTLRFLSPGSLFGVIPTSATWHRVTVLLDDLHHTTQDEVAPVHSTVAVKLALCAMLGLLAALVDLIAVVGRHGALAGVPLLVVYTVAGAVPHRSVSWTLFLGPAIGFLVLLALDGRDDQMRWGHRIARPGRQLVQPALTRAGQRIGLLALLLAVVLPFATPASGNNLVSALLRHHGSGSGNGIGAGGSIDPWAALKGQLTRTTPINLADVTVNAPPSVTPFYLRENVLSVFTGSGWKASPSRGRTDEVGSGVFREQPDFPGGGTSQFTARIHVLGLSGNPPVFGNPTSVSGLDSASWSERDQLLVGAKLHSGQAYSEMVLQPNPSINELRAAPDVTPDASMQQWLELPKIPRLVRTLVTRLTKGANGPYERARDIAAYFTDPANGFQYSLQTKAGDSGNDLVDFLTNKTGYCQQYAAAMAVMLRLAQVPARVVLGYTHQLPNAVDAFTVTTNDAHSWVEAYFQDVGWVPFDPTPESGLPGGATINPPWQRSPVRAPGSSSATPSNHPSSPSAPKGTRSDSAAAPGGGTGPSRARAVPAAAVPALVLLAVVLLLLTPWFIRTRRRRLRLRAAHAGNPDPLWTELSDTATDLGYAWSPTRSPRQVARWLGDAAGEARASLNTLARAVEEHHYSGAATPGADLRADLAAVTERLRAGRDRSQRLRAQLWPSSLGWSLGWLRRRRPADGLGETGQPRATEGLSRPS